METIGSLLLNYKIPGVQDAERRKVCREEIFALTGYTLTAKQLKFKETTLTLSVPSVLKSALLLRQSELRDRLKNRGVTLIKIV